MSEERSRILIIEDNPADARLIREMLRIDPYDIVTTDRLRKGIDILNSQTIHLVLVDLGLPDSSGLATLAQLLVHAPQLPVIVLTGLTDESLAVQAVREGAQDYFLKGEMNRNILLRALRIATERVRILQSLQEGATIFRQISEATQDAIVVINHEGWVTFWNPSAEKIFQYKAQEILGKELHVFVAPTRNLSLYRQGLASFAETGEGAFIGKTVELTGVRKDGEEFPLEMNVSAFRDKEGWNAVALVRDITGRKFAENMDHFREKMSSIGQLSAILTKELNTPLEEATHQFRELKEKVHNHNMVDEGVLTRVRRIEEYLERAYTIACELHTFSSREKPRFAPVDCNELVREATSLMRHKFHHVEILEILDELPDMQGDPILLLRVFLSLLRNAAESLPHGGTIDIVTRLEEETIIIEVRDSGIGIAKEHLSMIFSPFFTTKQKESGTGLGLALCKKIISQHNGTIHVTSGEQQGTVVIVELPLHGNTNASPLDTETAQPHDTSLYPIMHCSLDEALNIFSNPLRRKVIDLLMIEPSSSLTDLTRRMGIEDHTKVLFHLRILREARIVLQHEDRTYELSENGRWLAAMLNKIRSFFPQT